MGVRTVTVPATRTAHRESQVGGMRERTAVLKYSGKYSAHHSQICLIKIFRWEKNVTKILPVKAFNIPNSGIFTFLDTQTALFFYKPVLRWEVVALQFLPIDDKVS